MTRVGFIEWLAYQQDRQDDVGKVARQFAEPLSGVSSTSFTLTQVAHELAEFYSSDIEGICRALFPAHEEWLIEFMEDMPWLRIEHGTYQGEVLKF